MAQAQDTDLLTAALVGYRSQLAHITSQIAALEQRLGHNERQVARKPAAKASSHVKHEISAEGRARIAEAQRARWAAAKKPKVRTAAG